MSGAGARVLRLLAGAALQMAAALALAHASLVESEPADGAVLNTAPQQIRLRFSETVTPLRLTLLLPDGTTEPLNGAAAEPDGVVAPVAQTRAAGTYLLSWRVVSADGHPVGGALTYSIGSASAFAGVADVPPAPGLAVAIWLTRLLLYLGLFVGIGGVVFEAFMPSAVPRAGRATRAAFAIALPALAVAVALQGLDVLAAPWSSLLSLATALAGLATSYGVSAALLLVAVLFAAAASRAGRADLRRGCAALALVAVAAAIAASGHASVAPPRWLARPGVFVHAAAVTLWAGSLWPLLLSLRAPQGSANLARFSRAAPWVVSALLASGVLLSLLQLDLPRPILSTAYGRVWAAKLLLVVAILGIAAINRFRLTARAEQGDVAARRRMTRLIGAEIALVVAVLALVATWRLTPPPRALAPTPTSVRPLHLEGAGASADLAISAQGERSWLACVTLTGPGGAPLDPSELALVWSAPSPGAESLRRAASKRQDGRWCTEPVSLPVGGRWHVVIEAAVSDFDRVRLEGDVSLPQPRASR